MRTQSAGVERPRLAAVGLAILVVATLIFLAGLVGVVMDIGVALIPMMFAFGLFTFGIGVVIAARR